MKATWKKYLLYGSLIIVGGGLIFILVETIRAENTGFETKTLWDWMELLVIPVVLAVGAFYLNRSERTVERQIATDRQQEAALQAYLDRMTELLLKENLRISENEEVRNVVRIRTLTVLRGLDSRRKSLVIKFLHEARLISTENTLVNLEGADLTDVELPGANLQRVNLAKTSLVGANLGKALLLGANLFGADLRGAYLKGAKLKLSDVGHFLNEPLNLADAGLADADLSGAKLKDAIMPDGTKHE